MSGVLKNRVYSHIYEKLSNGELLPGDRLSGRALAKEIGVSPIPVRDAISQLRNEGFIETRRGGGAFVPEPSYEDLMDIYDQREALECHAVERVATSPHETDLADLDNCVEELSQVIESLDTTRPPYHDSTLLDRWIRADAAFHDTLMRAAGNQRSLKTVLNLRIKTRIFGTQVRYKPCGSLRRTHEEHRRIVEAIRNHDVDGARAAMSEHIHSGCRAILEAHRRKRVSMDDGRSVSEEE
ncbi:MAG: GntR family transcriptional regulator [Pirellulales bacterium]|nr:GntR family transcriptional regulator [Pirellulales bacterium]